METPQSRFGVSVLRTWSCVCPPCARGRRVHALLELHWQAPEPLWECVRLLAKLVGNVANCRNLEPKYRQVRAAAAAGSTLSRGVAAAHRRSAARRRPSTQRLLCRRGTGLAPRRLRRCGLGAQPQARRSTAVRPLVDLLLEPLFVLVCCGRQVKRDNAKLQDKVLSVAGAAEVLEAAGFACARCADGRAQECAEGRNRTRLQGALLCRRCIGVRLRLCSMWLAHCGAGCTKAPLPSRGRARRLTLNPPPGARAVTGERGEGCPPPHRRCQVLLGPSALLLRREAYVYPDSAPPLMLSATTLVAARLQTLADHRGFTGASGGGYWAAWRLI